MVLVTGFSLFALQSITVESATSPRAVAVSPSQPTYYPVPAAGCAPASPMPPPLPASYSSGAATCAPAPSIPPPSLSMPLPLSAAPSFCPSGEVCSPAVRAAYSDDVAPESSAPAPRVAPVAPTSSNSHSQPPSSPASPSAASPSESYDLAPLPPAPTNPAAKALPSNSNRPSAPTDSLDPPSDEEVLRALDKAKPTQSGFLHSVQRNNVRIVKEKVSDFADPPSVTPLLGPVQIHHAHYKCTVYYTEVTRTGFPASSTVNEDAKEVVYIDRSQLLLAANLLPASGVSY